MIMSCDNTVASTFLLSFASVYVIMLLAEFADKTNLIALSMMNLSKRPFLIAFGGLLGISFTTVIGVLLGSFVGFYIPLHLVAILSGVIFVALGLLSFKTENDDTSTPLLSTDMPARQLLVRSAIFISFAEFGDKSQVFVFSAALAENPFAVFLGAVLGMATVMYITAIFGQQLIHHVDAKILRYISAVLFIFAGIWLIFTTIV